MRVCLASTIEEDLWWHGGSKTWFAREMMGEVYSYALRKDISTSRWDLAFGLYSPVLWASNDGTLC
jgi:hypothetical protein